MPQALPEVFGERLDFGDEGHADILVAGKAQTSPLVGNGGTKRFDWYERKVLPPALPRSIVSYRAKGKPKPAQEGITDEGIAIIADILGGLYGRDALRMIDAADKSFPGYPVKGIWRSEAHPRDPKTGRFVPVGQAGYNQANSVIRSIRSGHHKESDVKDLAVQLSALTVKQLRQLQREHNLKADAKLKEQLIEKLSARLQSEAANAPPKISAAATPEERERLRQHLESLEPKPPPEPEAPLDVEIPGGNEIVAGKPLKEWAFSEGGELPDDISDHDYGKILHAQGLVHRAKRRKEAGNAKSDEYVSEETQKLWNRLGIKEDAPLPKHAEKLVESMGFPQDESGEQDKEGFLRFLKIPEVSELLNKSEDISPSDFEKLRYFLDEVGHTPLLKDKLKEALEKIKVKGSYKKTDPFKGMKLPAVPKVNQWDQRILSPVVNKLKELARSGDLKKLEEFDIVTNGYSTDQKATAYKKALVDLLKQRIQNTGSNAGFQALAELNVAFDNASVAIPSLNIGNPKVLLKQAGFDENAPAELQMHQKIKLPPISENKAIGLKKGQLVYLREKDTGKLFGITEIIDVENDVDKGTVTPTLGNFNATSTEGVGIKHDPEHLGYYKAGYKGEELKLNDFQFGMMTPIQKQLYKLGSIDRENNMPPGTSIDDTAITKPRIDRIQDQVHKFDRPAPMMTAITRRFAGAGGAKDKIEKHVNYAGKVNYGSNGAYTKKSPMLINALYTKAVDNIMNSVQRGEKLKQGSVQERVESEAKKIVDSYSADADGLYQLAKELDGMSHYLEPLRFHPLKMSFGARISKTLAGNKVLAIPVTSNVYGKPSANLLSEFAQAGGKNAGVSPSGSSFYIDPENATDVAVIRNLLLKAGYKDAMAKNQTQVTPQAIVPPTLPPSGLTKSLQSWQAKSLLSWQTKDKQGQSYFGECPRDEGGHCLPSGQADQHAEKESKKGKKEKDKEAPTEPPCCLYAPSDDELLPKEGQPATQARVGVPADQVPPPPNEIGRLPNLNKKQREVESRFADAYLEDPDGMAKKYLKALKKRKVGEYPNVFATDDVKALNPDWNPGKVRTGEELDKETKKAMAKYNAAVHQTANAIAKRAFIKYLDDVVSQLPENKRRVLVTNGGCHAKDTPILMFDGSIKMVQNVLVGDLLMGPDSQPRKVLHLVRGHDAMYRIIPKRGRTFVVNADHILSIKTRRGLGSAKRTKWVTLNISVREVLARGDSFRRNSWIYRTGVEFPYAPVAVDPYFLGLWLGDGTHSVPQITTADKEIADYLTEFTAAFPDLKLMVSSKPNNRSSNYRLALKDSVPCPKIQFGKEGAGRKNPIVQGLRAIGVWRNKHIPQCYLINDRSTRLAVLAGLLDSDGYLAQKFDNKNSGFEFTTNRERLAKEVEFLTRSLGFAAYAKRITKTNTLTGISGTYWQLHIAGDVSEIPTRIARKQAKPRLTQKANGNPSKDVLKTGYVIDKVGDGEFFGFVINSDHLYLMSDFTVTHNCAGGKGSTLARSSDPNDPHYRMLPASEQVGAIWDAAGEQNATENQWILDECKKRGIKPTFAYVWADPKDTWDGSDRGVIRRAMRKGRMVDARLFADSYAVGAKNMKAFVDKNPDADFIFIDNRKKSAPKLLDKFPEETLQWNSEQIYRDAVTGLEKRANELDPSLVKGGLIGGKIWGPPKEKHRD